MAKNLKKAKCEFNHEELNDVWSALTVWERELNKKENPRTHKAIKKLIVKVKKYLWRIT